MTRRGCTARYWPFGTAWRNASAVIIQALPRCPCPRNRPRPHRASRSTIARASHRESEHGSRDPRIARPRHGRRVGHRPRDSAGIRSRRRASSRVRRRPGGVEVGRGKRPRHRPERLRRCRRQAIARMFDQATATFGGLDALVNNAGIAGPTAACEDIALADWERTLAVNLTGQFLCAQRAIPWLRKSGNPSIANLSSAAGRFGFPMRTPYAASKWAVIGLSKSLAIELGRDGVRVNAICPGLGRRAAHRCGLCQQGRGARRLRVDGSRRSARQNVAAAPGVRRRYRQRDRFPRLASGRQHLGTGFAHRCRYASAVLEFASHRSLRAPTASGVVSY